jgi:2-polyprenyl-3-methyl-5-hydroxy-6-metoxy-1,4-benzoquinol methylase
MSASEIVDLFRASAEAVTNCPICTSHQLKTVDTTVSLCRCAACGFFFRNPRPTQSDIAQYYSGQEQYENWLTHEDSRNYLWNRRLKMLIQYGRSGRLLDVGAGIGQFLSLARSYYEVEGTEVSARAVEIAAERYGLDLHCGELEEIDFGHRHFDVITLFHVLEHVHDPRRLLLKCVDLLTHDGILVIAIPNEMWGWKRPLKSVLAYLGRRGSNASRRYGLSAIQLCAPGEEIHLSYFTTRTMGNLLNLCQLRVIHEDVDPCHASKGMKQLMHELAFRVCKVAHRLFRVQFGEAIWIAAERVRCDETKTSRSAPL